MHSHEVQIITPGTRVYSPYLTDPAPLYLLCIVEADQRSQEAGHSFGICFLHASTAEFNVGRIDVPTLHTFCLCLFVLLTQLSLSSVFECTRY